MQVTETAWLEVLRLFGSQTPFESLGSGVFSLLLEE